MGVIPQHFPLLSFPPTSKALLLLPVHWHPHGESLAGWWVHMYCFQQGYVPGSSEPCIAIYFTLLFPTNRCAFSPGGVAKKRMAMAAWYTSLWGCIGYYNSQFGRGPRNSSCRNMHSWNDLRITQCQPKVYIKLEDQDTEGLKHAVLPASVSQGVPLWWCYSTSRLYVVPDASTTTLCSLFEELESSMVCPKLAGPLPIPKAEGWVCWQHSIGAKSAHYLSKDHCSSEML